VTEKVVDAPTTTVRFAGCDVITRAVYVTVSVALFDVTDPAALVTVQANTAPVSDGTGVMVYDDDVAPTMSTPPLRHWYVKGDVPVAVTENVADEPADRVSDVGWLEIVGATAVTVSVAPALVADPMVFVTRQVNTAPLSMSCALDSVYEAAVAPEMLTPFFFHWYDRGDVPVATTVNVVDAPALMLREAGCDENDGAARVAASL
jgi:hypothetical protein